MEGRVCSHQGSYPSYGCHSPGMTAVDANAVVVHHSTSEHAAITRGCIGSRLSRFCDVSPKTLVDSQDSFWSILEDCEPNTSIAPTPLG